MGSCKVHAHNASIADHMYRMAVLAMCTSDATLDVSKSVSLPLSTPYHSRAPGVS